MIREDSDFESLASRFIDSFDKNRDSILKMEEEKEKKKKEYEDKLLELLFNHFEKIVSEIEKGYRDPSDVLVEVIDSWEKGSPYYKMTNLIDRLGEINALKEFEKKYCLFFWFDQIADRDSYADPKHYVLRITWDYTRFLKKVKNGNNQSKVLRRVMN